MDGGPSECRGRVLAARNLDVARPETGDLSGQEAVSTADDSELAACDRLSSAGSLQHELEAERARAQALEKKAAALEEQLMECARAGQGLLAQNQGLAAEKRDLELQATRLEEAQGHLLLENSELDRREKLRRRSSSRPHSRASSRRLSGEAESLPLDVFGGSDGGLFDRPRSLSGEPGERASRRRCSTAWSVRSVRASRRASAMSSAPFHGGGEEGADAFLTERDLRRLLGQTEEQNSQLLVENTQLHECVQRLETEVRDLTRSCSLAEAESHDARQATPSPAASDAEGICGAARGPAPSSAMLRLRKAGHAVTFALRSTKKPAERPLQRSRQATPPANELQDAREDALSEDEDVDAEGEDEEDGERALPSKRMEDLQAQLRLEAARSARLEQEASQLVVRCRKAEEERDEATAMWQQECERSAELMSQLEQLRALLDQEKTAQASAMFAASRDNLAADLSTGLAAQGALSRTASKELAGGPPPTSADPTRGTFGGLIAVETCSDASQAELGAARSPPPPCAPPPSPAILLGLGFSELAGKLQARRERVDAEGHVFQSGLPASPATSSTAAGTPATAASGDAEEDGLQAASSWSRARTAAGAQARCERRGQQANFSDSFPLWSRVFSAAERSVPLATGPGAAERPQWMRLFADASEALPPAQLPRRRACPSPHSSIA